MSDDLFTALVNSHKEEDYQWLKKEIKKVIIREFLDSVVKLYNTKAKTSGIHTKDEFQILFHTIPILKKALEGEDDA